MNQFFTEKIRDKSGESIAETLVAVLIAAFALLMLAGTVNTSTNLVLKSQKILSGSDTDSEDGYYDKNNLMEKRTGTPEKMTITISSTLDEPMTETVSLYKNDKFSNNQIFVYDIKTASE